MSLDSIPDPAVQWPAVGASTQGRGQWLDLLLARLPIVMVTIDKEGVFRSLDGRGLGLLGVEAGRVVGQSVDVACRDHPVILGHIRRALAGEQVVTVEHVGNLAFETRYIPMLDARGEVAEVTGMALEITRRVRVEHSLRQERNFATALVETLGTLVVVMDMRGRITLFNHVCESVTGYKAREMVGRSAIEVLVPPEERAEYRAIFESACRQARPCRHEHHWLTREGHRRAIEWSCAALTSENGEVTHVVASGLDMTDRRRAQEELRRSKVELEETVAHRTLDLTLAVRRLEQEVAQRREAQEQAMQRLVELARVSRLTAMGEMTAGLAHEINQPLSAIVNFARGCVRRIEGGAVVPADIADAMKHIADQATRAGAIVRHLKDFVRKQPWTPAAVDLCQLLREAAMLIETDLRLHGVVIVFELADDLPPVLADRVQIEQVVVNLLRNAMEAMSEVPSPAVVTVAARRAGGEAVVSVCDRGPGIPSDMMERVFEPFMTTKHSGLGMGLSISRSIIEAHSGRIAVYAAPQGGAEVRFHLPLQSERND